MKAFRLLFLFILYPTFINAQKNKDNAPKKYTRVTSGYLMVLREGDNVLEELDNFAIREKIPSANFTGMGFAEVEFGFFNYKTKSYEPKKFDPAELASITGSLAWQKDKPSIHAHGVIAGDNFKTYGGHILSAVVGKGSVEIMITVHEKRLERIRDEKLGANVLCVEKCD